MLSYGSRWSTVTTTTETQDRSRERRVRRMRLTLNPSESSGKQDDTRRSGTDTQGQTSSSISKKKISGYAQRERPVGAELPAEHRSDTTNGTVEPSPAPEPGPKVYAVVQRTGSDSQREVMAYEWSVSHLRDEMDYIREVRQSLEMVRERMYGQFDGMQQSMQKLSQQMRSTNSRKWNLKVEKPLADQPTDRAETQSQVRALQSSFEQAEQRLKDMEKQLATAREENRALRLQVESSQEANSQALRDLTQSLQAQFEALLHEEQQKYGEEIKALQTHLDECMWKIEEAEKKAKVAEAQIAEKDERIGEVERLLSCMVQEKSQLEQKLHECEQLLCRLRRADHADTAAVLRSQQLAQEAADLKDRIKHLNDMVFSQQKKVKGLIKEVDALKAKVAQKDVYITELLDRIAIVECENNELEDKLNYFLSMQNVTNSTAPTRDVGCDPPFSAEMHLQEEWEPRPVKSRPSLPSRVDSGELKYTGLQ
ncbi:myocardial zonula adherens protein-like isoform X1 [Scleropages formosus]|uniref:myocardial zonula adherens protein-like isoform X1 n=1 Tax=Scleropages formosus TaxID=113540 RepID=UPI0010FA9D4A|nr:myocardial zonula adherens protein-like isoform X1 [Scleropages formosus]